MTVNGDTNLSSVTFLSPLNKVSARDSVPLRHRLDYLSGEAAQN